MTIEERDMLMQILNEANAVGLFANTNALNIVTGNIDKVFPVRCASVERSTVFRLTQSRPAFNQPTHDDWEPDGPDCE